MIVLSGLRTRARGAVRPSAGAAGGVAPRVLRADPRGRSGGGGPAGLAATYSSAPSDAVPSAQRVFTAEFGMGSGVLPLAMATRPAGAPCRRSEKRSEIGDQRSAALCRSLPSPPVAGG